MMRIELCKSHFCFATCSLFASDHRPYREGPDRLKKVEELVSSCLRPPPPPWTSSLLPVDLLSAPPLPWTSCRASPCGLPASPHGPPVCPPLWTSCLPHLRGLPACTPPWTSSLFPVDLLSAPPPVDFLPGPVDFLSAPTVDFLSVPRGLPACPLWVPPHPASLRGLPACSLWTSYLPHGDLLPAS